MPTAGWWDALWPNPAGVLEAVGLRRDMAAIDLCCGDGWFTLPMSRVAASVVAIDIDRNMLEAARDRLAAAGATNCQFVEGDAYELARHMRGPADFVLMANAFHGVPDQPRLADAIGKALKPAGTACRCQLASAPARGNDDPGRAAGAKERVENVAGANHCVDRSRRPHICRTGRVAALSLRGHHGTPLRTYCDNGWLKSKTVERSWPHGEQDGR